MKLKRLYGLFSVAALSAIGLIRTGWAGDGLTPTVVVEEKIYLERVLEAKGQRALDAILGPKKAQITIVVDANPSATENVEMSADKKNEPSFTWRDPKSAGTILPGFHEEPGAVPIPPSGGRSSRISTVSRFIQKISGTIVTDRSVSEEDAKNAREAIYGVLALDAERGDSLQLIRGNILSEVKENLTWSLTTAYIALLFGIVGLTVIFFAFKAAHSLSASVKSAENMIQARAVGSFYHKEQKETAEEEEKEEAPSDTGKKKTAAKTDAATSAEETAPATTDLGSLGESSGLAIASFLADQPAAKAAAVISALRPDTAGVVLELLESARRMEVLKALGSDFNVTKDEKEKLAAALADFVRAFVHGPNVLVEIFESAPEAVQNKMAEDLANTSPALLAEVQAAALKTDLLWALPKDQWITLASEVSAEDLAAALQEAPASDRDRLAATLPGELAALVKQHLKLAGAITPDKAVAARRKLFAAARALRQAGKIKLTRVSRA